MLGVFTKTLLSAVLSLSIGLPVAHAGETPPPMASQTDRLVSLRDQKNKVATLEDEIRVALDNAPSDANTITLLGGTVGSLILLSFYTRSTSNKTFAYTILASITFTIAALWNGNSVNIARSEIEKLSKVLEEMKTDLRGQEEELTSTQVP